MAGCIFVPGQPDHGVRELERLLVVAKPSVILTQRVHADTLLRAAKTNPSLAAAQQPIFIFDDDVLDSTGEPYLEIPHWQDMVGSPAEDDWEYPDIQSSQDYHSTIMIMFTSGTTGSPKGVEVSHCNYISAATGYMQRVSLHPDWQQSAKSTNDSAPVRVLGALGMHLFLGQRSYSVIFPRLGVPVYLLRRPNSKNILDAVERFNISDAIIRSSMLTEIAKTFGRKSLMSKLGSLKRVEACAAPMPPSTKTILEDLGIGRVTRVWGLTELGLVTGHDMNTPSTLQSVGELYANCEGKVTDSSNPSQVVGRNTVGDIWIRTPSCSVGYYRNPEATHEARGSDGWFSTGDVGYVDERGQWYILDRKKDLIKVNGKHVAPTELEAVLLQHPDIVGAGVIGVAVNYDEGPRAYIETASHSSLSSAEIHRFMADKVTPYKYLSGGISFLPSIPRNSLYGDLLLSIMARRSPYLPPEIIISIAEHLDAQGLRSLILSSRTTAFLTSFLLVRKEYFFITKKYTTDLRDSDYWEGLIRAWDGEHLLYPFSRLSAEQVNAIDAHYNTLLHIVASAGNVELARILIDRGAKVSGGPLRSATKNGHEDVSRLLLAAGSNPCAFGEYQGNALYFSILNGTGSLVRLVLDAIRVATAKATATTIARATYGSDPLSVKEYVQRAKYGYHTYEKTPLVLAAERGELSVLEFVVSSDDLLQCGPDLVELLDIVSSRGYVACCEFLVGVIRGSRTDVDIAEWCTSAASTAICRGRVEVFKFFVDHGLVRPVPPVDGGGSRGEDLLRTALEHGQTPIVEFILERCPHLDLHSYLWPDLSRYTAVSENIPLAYPEIRRISTLLSLLKHQKIHHLNISTPSPFQNYTTLHFWSQIPAPPLFHIHTLLRSGANPTSQTTHDNLHIQTLLRSGANPHSQTTHGNLPLHLSASSGDALLPATKTLLSTAPETLTHVNNAGQTPLHSALTPENEPVTETVSLLLASGADLTSRDEGGRTPLHTAVLHNRGREPMKKWEAMKFLIDAGASLTAVDNEGATPAHLAVVGRQSLRFWVRRAFGFAGGRVDNP
ncbi:hypothetical protein FQN54_003808 [Arachnomyces sp. PD_36]|nr:hypothetical protein FQN54_003808 [Arachnomyces sp. PD_36]